MNTSAKHAGLRSISNFGSVNSSGSTGAKTIGALVDLTPPAYLDSTLAVLIVEPDATATAPAAAAAAGGVTVIGADDTGRAACSGMRMTDVKPPAGS